MSSSTSVARAPDGTDLLTRHWPAAGTPWAAVLLVHGLGEHSGRYDHVGTQMAAAGLDVHAYDHRGTGGSGGPRGDVAHWSLLHDDLQSRCEAVAAASPALPLVLYGHSMGALVVAGYALDGRCPQPAAIVLASPALDSTLARWKKLAAPVLARIAPQLRLPNGIDRSTLSRDDQVGARTARDPLCVRHSTTRFAAAGLREQARMRALAPRGFTMPALVLHGEDDGLVPPAASAVFDGAPQVTRRTYPGLRHELHNEPEGPRILADVIDWLRRFAALPPAH
ncbi:MAG: lysophospholipase [Acidobacteria bacterium]|nr:lysophospholipase [Acidobacteriota bacterium]